MLYITDSFPPVVNGVSYVVEHLAREMVRRGHHVEVATIDESRRLPRTEMIEGAVVRRFLGIRPAQSYHIPAPDMLRVLGDRADVVHVHNFHSVLPLIFSASLFEPERKRLMVVTPHFHTPGHHLHSKAAWLLYKPLLSLRIQRFDVIHCVSKFESDQVLQHFGVKSVIVGNGVDEDVYAHSWGGPLSKEIQIVFVGRLEHYKRIELVLEAAHLLNTRGYQTRVNIVGAGPEEGVLTRLARDLGLNLTLERQLPREQLLNLVAQSNCMVNASQFEAYSLVVAEALAMGVPAVITFPWGVNFSEYPRATVVDPTSEAIADGILKSRYAKDSAYRPVPVWGQIAGEMCDRVYATVPH